jgi:hypothetical protein
MQRRERKDPRAELSNSQSESFSVIIGCVATTTEAKGGLQEIIGHA